MADHHHGLVRQHPHWLASGCFGSRQLAAIIFDVQNAPLPNLTCATTSWNVGAALFPLVFVPLTKVSLEEPQAFVSRLRSERHTVWHAEISLEQEDRCFM